MRKRTSLVLGMIIAAGLTVGLLTNAISGKTATGNQAEKEPQPFKIEQFIDPDTCAGCHSEIFEQWENSMHNLSHKDPVYLRLAKFLREGLTDNGEILEAESCVKCHTPMGYVSGFPKQLSDDLSKTAPIAQRGIQCDYCHSATTIRKMYNNGLVLSPGQGEDDPGIKYGPYDDSEPDFHEAKYSPMHTESRVCGTCHNVKHLAFGTDLETTYTEWEQSPYNAKDPEKRITCQGCHMSQRPGIPATGSTPRPKNPGSATDYSDERPHIATHYFVGGNAAVPPMFNGDEKARMAEERLAHAATVELDVSRIKERQLMVNVTNTGAGHSIPTGLGDLRQVWLEIMVKDQENKVRFATGTLNDKGILGSDALMYKTVLGDGNGNPVINVSKAREILSDNRIKAKETRRHTIDIGILPAPGDVLSARLLYRSAPQKVLNLLPGKALGPLPVIEMDKTVIRF